MTYSYKVSYVNGYYSPQEIKNALKNNRGIYTTIYSDKLLTYKELYKEFCKKGYNKMSRNFTIIDIDGTLKVEYSKYSIYMCYLSYYYHTYKSQLKYFMSKFYFTKAAKNRREIKRVEKSIHQIPDKFWLHIKH